MQSSTPSRLGWFQVSLRSIFALTLVAAAFFAGWGISEQRAGKAIREAQDAADVARRQEEQFRRELESERQVLTIPCHPGCFPPGTLVRVPEGTKRIERIVEGDRVITLTSEGKPTSTKVASVFITRNGLFTVQTDAGSLETTQTQPVCLGSGELRAAGELKPGDVVLRWDGAGRSAATVREVTAGSVSQVFNLVLGDPTIFIAGDFLVRSKPPREQ
jgi:hypothetical protein